MCVDVSNYIVLQGPAMDMTDMKTINANDNNCLFSHNESAKFNA